MAFNAKNLTYDKSEPTFLRRLKAGYATQDGRNNVQHARPSKSRLRMGDGDDDDGPVIVDESGEVVEKHVYDDMLEGREQNESGVLKSSVAMSDADRPMDDPTTTTDDNNNKAGQRDKQKVADVGATKKRKVIKVIGGDEVDEDRSLPRVKSQETVKHTTSIQSQPTRKKNGATASTTTVDAGRGIPTVKKKAKKIKLSFEDPA